MATLQDQTQTHEQMMAELAKLRAENSRYKAQAQSRIRLKVSDKGCVTVIGVGSKYGVTQYAETWLKLFDMSQAIRDFIEENRDMLSWKHEQD